MSPRISVVIPTYNRCNLLIETLESVLAQTYKDFEVIVVNDGSSDSTTSVLKPYIENGLITYYEQENKGHAAARNLGLQHSSGEYITFLDDDDLWPSTNLENQLLRIQGTNFIAVGGLIGKIIDGKQQNTPIIKEDKVLTFEDFFRGNPFYTPGQVLISTKHVRAVNGFDPEIWGAEDLDLWMRLSHFGEMLRYSELSLWYRIHSDNSSTSNQTLRMLANSKKTVLKNAKDLTIDKRKQVMRDGYYWLLEYLGTRIINDGISNIKKLKFCLFFRYLFTFILTFFIPAFKDSRIIKLTFYTCVNKLISRT